MEVLNSEAYEQTDRLLNLVAVFTDRFGRKPEVVIRVPGRVNLIGEHIDYCGFAVHPMAIDQDILVGVAKSGKERHLRLCNTNLRFADSCLDLSGDTISIEKDGSNWSNYFLCGVKGVFEEMSSKICRLEFGIDCVVDGTIPPSSGLSSSSALVVASCLATIWAGGLIDEVSRSEVANLCARSERFIGTQGGGMDQAIEMLAKKGTAKLIEFNPLTATDVQLPEGATFVIANSLAEINKAAGPEFNTRVAETRLGAKVLAKELGLQNWRQILKFKQLGENLLDLLDSAKEQLHPEPYTRDEVCELLGLSDSELSDECLTENTRQLTSFQLRDRAVHVFSEAARVYEFKSVCDKAAAGDNSETNGSLIRLGELMFDSHESCSKLYQCSHPQLDQLVKLSKNHGALGARLTGAGWGGCIVALVPTDLVHKFIQSLVDDYYSTLEAAKGKKQSEFIFPTKPGGGSEIYKID